VDMKSTSMSGELRPKKRNLTWLRRILKRGEVIVEDIVACVFKLGVSNRRHSNVSC
jgi:hypothetical protein